MLLSELLNKQVRHPIWKGTDTRGIYKLHAKYLCIWNWLLCTVYFNEQMMKAPLLSVIPKIHLFLSWEKKIIWNIVPYNRVNLGLFQHIYDMSSVVLISSIGPLSQGCDYQSPLSNVGSTFNTSLHLQNMDIIFVGLIQSCHIVGKQMSVFPKLSKVGPTKPNTLCWVNGWGLSEWVPLQLLDPEDHEVACYMCATSMGW